MAIDKKQPPAPFPEMNEFWTALREGRLLLKHCEACSKAHFYPRVYCPFCGSAKTQWKESTGSGTVYSFSLPRKAKPPVAPAVIELQEGVRLVSVVREADLFSLEIGQSVVLYPRQQDGAIDLAFTTVAAREAREHARRASVDAADVPGLPKADPAAFARVAIIGAGTMGIGIAMALANASVAVTLVDVDDAAVQRGMARIREQYEVSVQRKRLSASDMQQRLGLITLATSYEAIADADAVIEAVWEQMALKKEVFARIDAHAKPGALLGTNTSALDVNAIAESTGRPQDVIGLHFFTPAQSMKLLELVRGRATSDMSIARAIALAIRLGKVPVLVESCPGFAGNRIFGKRDAQARTMLLEGASPEQIDRVLVEFGMPMGTFELQDMTGGVELSYRRRQSEGTVDVLGDAMFNAGRIGQKVGKGYYRYEPGNRKPLPDPELRTVVDEAARAAGIERRQLDDDEVRERLMLPMINEACKLIEEGVVARPTDVDAVWLHGYGWPAWRGGILHYADQLGAAHIHQRLLALQARHGAAFAPAALLVRIAQSEARFVDLPARAQRAAAFA